jgi:hypothetical protein
LSCSYTLRGLLKEVFVFFVIQSPRAPAMRRRQNLTFGMQGPVLPSGLLLAKHPWSRASGAIHTAGSWQSERDASCDANCRAPAINSTSLLIFAIKCIKESFGPPIRPRTARVTAGRPALPRRTFQVQNNRNPLRCQAITVSSFTMVFADRQSPQIRERITHTRRSAGVSFGRFLAERPGHRSGPGAQSSPAP